MLVICVLILAISCKSLDVCGLLVCERHFLASFFAQVLPNLRCLLPRIHERLRAQPRFGRECFFGLDQQRGLRYYGTKSRL